MQPALVIKRVYAPVADEDGLRVSVDRLWPRGLSKDKRTSTGGPRSSPPAMRFGNGSGTTRKNGTNSDAATHAN